MTTQDTIPAEPVAATGVDGAQEPEPEEPPREYKSLEDVLAEVADRVGLGDPQDVLAGAGRGLTVAWEDPSGKIMVLKQGEPSPFNANGAQLIFAMFHDEEEVRVYAVPREKGPLERYHLSKRGRTFVKEHLADAEQLVEELETEVRTAEGMEDELTEPENN